MEFNNITLKLVEVIDAEFILNLRTDIVKQKYISATNNSLKEQVSWIKNYKLREKNGDEFYFIAIDENQERFALYRIYKIKTGLPEIGSWISKPGYKKFTNSILLDVLIKDFVFRNLNFEKLQFEVRKENITVNNYHKLFEPKKIREDELNNYYILDKASFDINVQKILKKFKI